MMLAHTLDPRRLIPVWIAFLAVASVLGAVPSRADPIAVESGWTVRKFVEGLHQFIGGLAGDEVSGDLFVADAPVYPPVPVTIYRVAGNGTRTPLFTSDRYGASFMAFDPSARLLYAVNVTGALVVLTEAGAVVDQDSVPDFALITGTTLGPDGMLYLLDERNLRIVRYDRAAHAFPIVTTLGPLAGTNVGSLAMDADGNFFLNANYYNVVRVTPSGVISYGAGPKCVGVEGLAFYGSDLIQGYFTQLYRLPGALGQGTLFADHIPVVWRMCVVQDRIYVKDARQNFCTVWEFAPVGPTQVRNATWGRLKSLYR
jgi:sugar lactone lactonase YvrE